VGRKLIRTVNLEGLGGVERMLGNDRNASDTDTAGNTVSSTDRAPGVLAAPGRWRWVFALAVAVSVVVLFMPGNHVPHAPNGVDKVVHCTLFLTLCVTGLLAGSQARWLVPILLAYAVSSEFIQTLPILQRDFSVWDIAADTAGVLLGALVLAWARRGWSA
jgi:hypothetical protein